MNSCPPVASSSCQAYFVRKKTVFNAIRVARCISTNSSFITIYLSRQLTINNPQPLCRKNHPPADVVMILNRTAVMVQLGILSFVSGAERLGTVLCRREQTLWPIILLYLLYFWSVTDIARIYPKSEILLIFAQTTAWQIAQLTRHHSSVLSHGFIFSFYHYFSLFWLCAIELTYCLWLIDSTLAYVMHIHLS